VSVRASTRKVLRTFQQLACALAIAGPSACVREHTLFETTGDGNAAGNGSGGDNDGNGPGATAEPWTEQTCVAALSRGESGDPCVGTFSCSANAQSCQIGALCSADTLMLKTTCDTTGLACKSDGDCGSGRICEGDTCLDCPVEACPDTWSRIARNGCSVCVPPNRCAVTGDANCAEGQVCVAGLSCPSSCKNDPACCFGNQCTLPACTTLEGADCLIVGCVAGFTCKVVGEPVGCKCDQLGKWTCSSPPMNVCVPR
jgi:hypothetical protein